MPPIQPGPDQVTERSRSYYEQERLRAVIGELARRKAEALNLYEPLPAQDEFHRSQHQERLLRGSNRGGKTLPAAVEIARAVCGRDPHDKYPKTGGVCVCVGKDLAHCADPMWKKLSRPGAFKIIRDQNTSLWRAYRPYDSADLIRKREAKPAPPLIPPRFIKHIAWKDKKQGAPLKVILHNGWEIWFRSSEGKPPQGIDVDLVWFDEEIIDPDWYSEMAARLVDRHGKFIWSTTPQFATEQLWLLHRRAAEQDPLVLETYISLAANKFISEQDKLELIAKISPEQRRVRVEGEYALLGHLVYPEYSKLVHNCDWFQIPEDWTRILAIDPGRQVCAVLFLAIPPSNDHVYLYDELYIRQCNAEKLAAAMEPICRHHRFYQFLIDGHAARVSEMGSGVAVEERYRRALAKHHIRSDTTGSGFVYGDDDPQAGILAFREWLRTTADGTPYLQVLRGACPEFEDEISLYHYAKVKGITTDKPSKTNDHLMDCARYLAASDPVFVKQKKRKKKKSWAVLALQAKRDRIAMKETGTDRRHISLGSKGHT